MANSRSRLQAAFGWPALALGVFAAVATAQPPVPATPTVTGALPTPAQTAVPLKIDPIVPPAVMRPGVVAPVARTRAATTAKPVATKLPACKSGERLQRKAGACTSLAVAATKAVPAKAASKVTKPKPNNKRG